MLGGVYLGFILWLDKAFVKLTVYQKKFFQLFHCGKTLTT